MNEKKESWVVELSIPSNIHYTLEQMTQFTSEEMAKRMREMEDEIIRKLDKSYPPEKSEMPCK